MFRSRPTACSVLVIHGLTLLSVHETALGLLIQLLFHRWPYSVPTYLWFDCQLCQGVQLVCCWNREVTIQEGQWSLRTWYGSQVVCILFFSDFRRHKTECTRLERIFVSFLVSLSSIHPSRVLDFVHCTRRFSHCFRHQSWHWQLAPVNWLLVLDSKSSTGTDGWEVAEIPGSSWGSSSSSSESTDLCAFWQQVDHLASPLPTLFSFLYDFVDCPCSGVKLICDWRGYVGPQLLILHLYPDWLEADSEALWEEVQHVGAAGQICGGVCWKCSLRCTLTRSGLIVEFWYDLVAQLAGEGFTIVWSSSGSTTGSWICNKLLDDHRLHLRSLAALVRK